MFIQCNSKVYIIIYNVYTMYILYTVLDSTYYIMISPDSMDPTQKQLLISGSGCLSACSWNRTSKPQRFEEMSWGGCPNMGEKSFCWRNPAPVGMAYPIIYRVSYMLGGAGFLPSTVPPLLGGKDTLQKTRKHIPPNGKFGKSSSSKVPTCDRSLEGIFPHLKFIILLMEEIMHHLGCRKPCK